MNGKELGGEEIEIVLAKPPDKKKKERQAARQTSRNTGLEIKAEKTLLERTKFLSMFKICCCLTNAEFHRLHFSI